MEPGSRHQILEHGARDQASDTGACCYWSCKAEWTSPVRAGESLRQRSDNKGFIQPRAEPGRHSQVAVGMQRGLNRYHQTSLTPDITTRLFGPFFFYSFFLSVFC